MISLLATSAVVALRASEHQTGEVLNATLKALELGSETAAVETALETLKTVTEGNSAATFGPQEKPQIPSEAELLKLLSEQKTALTKRRVTVADKKSDLLKAQTATLVAQKESDATHTPYQAKQSQLDVLKKQRDDKKAEQKKLELTLKKLATETGELSVQVNLKSGETVAVRRLYNETKLKTAAIKQKEKAAQKELEEARKQWHQQGTEANATVTEINKPKTGSWMSTLTFGLTKDEILDPIEQAYRATSPDQLELFNDKK